MGYLIIILIFVIVVLFLRNNQLQADNHVFKAEKNISQAIEVSEYERLVLNYQKRRSDERSALIESIWKNENPQTNKMDFDMEILSKLHNEYESVEKLQEGIARVSRKDKEGKKKYGFVDASGQLIIPLIYSYASDFKEDVAIVSPTASQVFMSVCGGKCGVINKKGEYVIFPAYDELRKFSEGLSACRIVDKWGFIDKKGNMVITPQYLSIYEDFKDGLAIVEKEHCKWYYIDKNGEGNKLCNIYNF